VAELAALTKNKKRHQGARAYVVGPGGEEKSYESFAMGNDFRYVGKKIIGSALAVDDHVVHMAFFRATEAEIAGRMAGMNWRRGFRMEW